MASKYQPANISDQELDQIKDLEQDMEKVIVAVEPKPQFARLSENELTDLQQAEKKLGVVMLAYEQQ